MDVVRSRQLLIKIVRWSPIFTLSLLAAVYLSGGFERASDGPQTLSLGIKGLYVFVGTVPILFIVAFTLLSRANTKAAASLRAQNQIFSTADLFELPSEKMHGFKLALITERPPRFTGLTGDSYGVDESARCSLNPEHVPPVAQCECGYYAYKTLSDAKFELTMNPGAFLIDVDMFGVGFLYKHGMRAETQVVNQILIPKKCMRCKIFAAKVFVTTYKFAISDVGWWQWGVRCSMCSATFNKADTLTFDDMSQQLGIKRTTETNL